MKWPFTKRIRFPKRHFFTGQKPQMNRLSILATIFLATIVFWYFMAVALSKASVLEVFLTLIPQQRINGVNILAFGIDDLNDSHRADSIIILHVDTDKKRIGVLSIPRDTRVNVPGYGITKINHSYAYGGTKLLKKTVSDFLSIPIDYYIRINLACVEQMIDSLGGLTLHVDKNLYYTDQAGDLFIDIKQGNQTLNGKQSMQYLRFRQDREGDIGRIRRQHTFLQAFSQKAATVGKGLGFTNLIRQLSGHIKTDFSLSSMVGLVNAFQDAYQNGDIINETVPGVVTLEKGVSYWRPDIVALDRVVQYQLFGFEQSPLSAEVKVQTIDPSASQEDRRKVTLKEVTRIAKQMDIKQPTLKQLPKPLIIEVLNGYGGVGEAMAVAHQLRLQQMRIKRFNNAGSFSYEETLLVDWKGDIQNTLVLAQALSIDPTKIIVYDRPDKKLDVTLVLGKDWPFIKQKLGW